MKNFKQYLESLGLNYKKEVIKITLSNIFLLLISTILVFLFKQKTFILIGIILLLVLNYFLFNSYKDRKKQIAYAHEEEFITVISYFQIFINNHFNVYQSLNSIKPYCSPWMNEQITMLIEDIDRDKSPKPFVIFANKFISSIAENVMLSIYQMIDEGESNIHILQFTSLFDRLSISHQRELINNHEKSLSTLSSFPLIGAGAITILLTIGIISLMGEMINVL